MTWPSARLCTCSTLRVALKSAADSACLAWLVSRPQSCRFGALTPPAGPRRECRAEEQVRQPFRGFNFVTFCTDTERQLLRSQPPLIFSLFREFAAKLALIICTVVLSVLHSSPVTNALSNEALLFCCVSADSIDTVAERGFMKEERQFGLGIYFIDNATKGSSHRDSVHVVAVSSRFSSSYCDVQERCRPEGVHFARSPCHARRPLRSSSGNNRIRTNTSTCHHNLSGRSQSERPSSTATRQLFFEARRRSGGTSQLRRGEQGVQQERVKFVQVACLIVKRRIVPDTLAENILCTMSTWRTNPPLSELIFCNIGIGTPSTKSRTPRMNKTKGLGTLRAQCCAW
jgi:hypothetical protein